MRTGDDDEMRMVMAERHAATMAERERCAKIADEHIHCEPYEVGCSCDEIARRIRSGE